MSKGVTRPDEVAHLGLSNRLLARVGALLKKNVALSLAVLESAAPRSELETFLLRNEVLAEAATLDGARLNTLAAESKLATALALETEGAQRVVCLLDEVDGGEWSVEPLALAPVAKAELVRPVKVEVPGSANVFSAETMTRARLKLATGVSADERIEALRTLLLAPLSAAEKGEILLTALADATAAVRAEAAKQLVQLGASAAVAEALGELNDADSARRMTASEKLHKLALGSLSELEEAALIICALALLKGDATHALKLRLLQALTASAGMLGRNTERLAEIVRVAATALAATARVAGPSAMDATDMYSACAGLLRELGKRFPEGLKGALQDERPRAPGPASEALLLGALYDLIPAGSADEAELLKHSAAFLARDTEEGRDSRAIGALLSRRGPAALRALAEHFDSATPAAKRHFLLLIDDVSRAAENTGAELAVAAQVVLAALESGAKALRMSAMECRFVFDPRVPAELRERLAGMFLDSTGDFTFSFDVEKVESSVARMGIPAIAVLTARLSPARAANERRRAARLLGELALRVNAGPGQFSELQAALTDALRALEGASLEEKFPDRGEVFAALGKLIASPAAALEAGEVVKRTLFTAAQGTDMRLRPRALEGISYLAAARRARPELIEEARALLAVALDAAEREELESIEHPGDGETMYELKGGEQYVVALPLVIEGLERIALAPNASASVLANIGSLLLAQWKDVCAGKRIWGPVNTQLLPAALANLADSEKCGDDLRIEILTGLAARLYLSHVMQSMARVLTHFDSPQLGGVALSIGYGILARRDAEGRFEREERPEILRALTKLAARKNLLAPRVEAQRTPVAFRETVVQELFKGLNDGIAGMDAALGEMGRSEAISPERREEIVRRLGGRSKIQR